jgi:hypothetical protein
MKAETQSFPFCCRLQYAQDFRLTLQNAFIINWTHNTDRPSFIGLLVRPTCSAWTSAVWAQPTFERPRGSVGQHP